MWILGGDNCGAGGYVVVAGCVKAEKCARVVMFGKCLVNLVNSLCGCLGG